MTFSSLYDEDDEEGDGGWSTIEQALSGPQPRPLSHGRGFGKTSLAVQEIVRQYEISPERLTELVGALPPVLKIQPLAAGVPPYYDFVSQTLYAPRRTTDTKETRTMKKTEIRAELARQTAVIEEARESIARLERQLHRPAEPATGFITFGKQYSRGGILYSYAAIKAGARWYITGSTCARSGYSWDQLLDFIEQDNVGTNPGYNILRPGATVAL